MNEYTRIAELLKKTYEAEMDDEIKKVEEKTSQITFVQSDRYKNKIAKLCRRMNRHDWRSFNNVGKRAASIIGILVVISCVNFSVDAVRDGLHRFVTSFFSDHTEVSVSDADDKSSYQQTIEKVYEISSIPEGFQRAEYEVDDKKVRYKYFKDEKFIFFEQFTDDIYKASHDNEHSDYKSITSNGQDYLMIYSEIDTSYTFIWENGEYVFEVRSNLSETEVMNICESVR